MTAPHRRRHRTLRRLGAIGLVIAASSAGAVYLTVEASSSLAATSASVWLTTPDKTNLLAQQEEISFGTSGSGSTITVDPSATYQTMVGFGASLTDAAAYNIANSPARDTIMSALFDQESGIGLSFLRQPVGSSDFSLSFYTYADGAADPSLSSFSVEHDESYILPLLTQALETNPEITVMATPWSAPAWMKTSGSLIGGSLSTTYQSAYADYLVRFVEAYQGAGVPISYLSVQNEPQYSPSGYPGMVMDAAQQSEVVVDLAAKLADAGLDTQILAWDHNWDDTSFGTEVLASAGDAVAGTAWHCYAGDPTGQSTVHDSYPSKAVFFTECSGTESEDTANTFADSLWWQGRNLAIGSVRNWASTVSTWNMALDTSHGPVIGSCANCMGVVTVDGDAVTYNAEYYVLGHLSGFVQPGAVRIDSTEYAQGGIENVAFRNPDGTIVLVAINTGATQSFQVSYSGSSFGYTLPAGSMATFTWAGSGGSDSTATATATGGGTGATGAITGYGGRCVDVTDWNSANGTLVQLWDCTGGDNQQWTVGSDGTIQSMGKCLDLVDQGTANGTQVQLWDCTGGDNQRWTASDGQLISVSSGRCLDATGPSSDNGTKLQIWDCTGGDNQRWTLPG